MPYVAIIACNLVRKNGNISIKVEKNYTLDRNLIDSAISTICTTRSVAVPYEKKNRFHFQIISNTEKCHTKHAKDYKYEKISCQSENKITKQIKTIEKSELNK